jgi:hypothetical protein
LGQAGGFASVKMKDDFQSLTLGEHFYRIRIIAKGGYQLRDISQQSISQMKKLDGFVAFFFF